jgi:hypothetical protein
MDRDAADFRRDFRQLDDNPSLNDAVEALKDTRHLCDEAIDRIEELEGEVSEKQTRIEALEKALGEVE